MEYKPWPLLILAFFHFIEPVLKILFYSTYFQMNPVDVTVIEFQTASPIHVFEYFFLFPIAGLAIFSVKKWSFPVFIAVEVWVLAANLPYLTELYQTNQLWLFGFFITFGILNITVVGYLLLPAVRIAYLDPHLRWWESKPRYAVDISVNINGESIGMIKNISKSGIFIATHNDLLIDSELKLEFSLIPPNESHIKLNALVQHKFSINNTEGFGVRFTHLSASNKRLINSMINHLDKSGYDRRPPRRNMSDLTYWLKTLIQTGKGLSLKTN